MMGNDTHYGEIVHRFVGKRKPRRGDGANGSKYECKVAIIILHSSLIQSALEDNQEQEGLCP